GSATPGTRAEILRVLRIPQAEVVVTSFDRPNLVFCVERVRDDRERFARMRELIRGVDGPVIVYTPTRRLTELVARALSRLGAPAAMAAAPTASWCGVPPTSSGAMPQQACDATSRRGRVAVARCSRILESGGRRAAAATCAG